MNRLLAVVLWSAALFGQESPRESDQAKGAPGYSLKPGDLLDIKFFYNPELNQQAVIRPDGRITLQLVDEVDAAGETAGGLTQKLRQRYEKDLVRPEIAIVVRSFSSQKAFVDGEVNRPGVIELINDMTVMQCISQAGGLRETARPHEILLVRRAPAGGPRIVRVDLTKVLQAKAPFDDPVLRPFDVIYVPKSRISKVNSWVDQYIRKNVPITFGFYTPVF